MHGTLRLAIALLAGAFLYWGCIPGEESPTSPRTKDPQDTSVTPKDTLHVVPGPPELVHTKKNLILTPKLAAEESLYVTNAKAGEWTVTLLDGPPGTSLHGEVISYFIAEGMTGEKIVKAVATHPDGRILKAEWTVIATPKANALPVLVMGPHPDRLVVGRTLRIPVLATDPDGDSMHFENQLPAGATLHDSVLEWTPAKAQIGLNPFTIILKDTRAGVVAEKFDIQVSEFDPFPFAADLSPGRAWWIRGYSMFRRTNQQVDSITLRRQVRILSHDPASGNFSFRLIDTVQSGATAYSDTILTANFLPDFGFRIFGSPGYSESLPFQLKWVSTVREAKDFAIDGSTYHGLEMTDANTCLNPDYFTSRSGGCGGSASLFAPGLGLVGYESEGASQFQNVERAHSSFSVWKVE
jgi:hypothetical protein